MAFDPSAFFNGFTTYLQQARSQAARFIAPVAAGECWFQFEAASWIDQNREAVGISLGDAVRPDWDVRPELKKVDIWLRGDKQSPAVQIELKNVFNNKNCSTQIAKLRHDLRRDRILPPTQEG